MVLPVSGNRFSSKLIQSYWILKGLVRGQKTDPDKRGSVGYKPEFDVKLGLRPAVNSGF
jgi:hypothetical protein